jgi:hypothetical protein
LRIRRGGHEEPRKIRTIELDGGKEVGLEVSCAVGRLGADDLPDVNAGDIARRREAELLGHGRCGARVQLNRHGDRARQPAASMSAEAEVSPRPLRKNV